jgi:hypothetical protein
MKTIVNVDERRLIGFSCMLELLSYHNTSFWIKFELRFKPKAETFVQERRFY